MKHLFLLFAALALTKAASDVLEFTDSDFKTEITKHDIILVEFFAPWCGHCKKLAPEYEKAAKRLQQNDPPIPLAKVDCTANTATCGDFGVSGYPTLKLFRGGEFSEDYKGPREADGIVTTLSKQAGPASKVIETVAEYNKFLTKDTPVVIGYFEADNPDLKDFESAANALREDYVFGHTTAEEVLAEANSKNVVKLHRPKRLKSIFEEQVVTIDGKPTKSNLRTFLNKAWFGLCYHLIPSNLQKFKKPLVIAFDSKIDYAKNPRGSNYWRNRVMKFGKNFADKLNFAVANREEMKDLLIEGVPEPTDENNPPPVIVIIDESDKKYVMTETFSAATFEAFLTSYLAGDITPFVKTEAIPEPNDDPVTVVVGQTFDDIVMDETKDVLIEFYAPWCGHCKSLAPKWDELGEKFKDNKDLVIAKMDATANDSPKQFAVSGFPTIYWAPKNKKMNPDKYSGGREVKDFVKFLENAVPNTKTEL